MNRVGQPIGKLLLAYDQGKAMVQVLLHYEVQMYIVYRSTCSCRVVLARTLRNILASLKNSWHVKIAGLNPNT